ncbi:acetyltransferase (GNAT) family protein [Acinetobacter calcoaceticus]|uniref:Acetyltransferase (GNAT) family protein n=1 Tax=Acinetobacter calcoaceticus TaxID=471 RepID=A0A4R1XVP8_ACICA|nr:acetyltransferase (GNAT) family protein [Acinetobacter calcoaceticus]
MMFEIEHVDAKQHGQQLKQLLLEADPDWENIAQYLEDCSIFAIRVQQQWIAQICLYPISHLEAEIKNLAVASNYRGQGLAKLLIAHVIKHSRQLQLHCLSVKTGNSSLDQLALYQKMGFRMHAIERDVFLNYPQPIYENGIRCLDQVVLELQLSSTT